MRLDHVKSHGPQYVTTMVMRDEGGPPTNSHQPPTSMGVAWYAINEMVARGAIIVIDGAS